MQYYWNKYPDYSVKELNNLLLESVLPVFTEQKLKQKASLYRLYVFSFDDDHAYS